MFEITS